MLTLALIIFLFMEVSNVFILYFFPGSKNFNGAGVFRAYEKSKADPEVHALVKYLIYWVAGTKLIFIFLLLVILFTGGRTTQLLTLAALILSILSFFWRLFPGIRKMDKGGAIDPPGYSVTLGWMISGILILFTGTLIFELVWGAGVGTGL